MLLLKKIFFIVQNPFAGTRLFDVLASQYFVVEATNAPQALYMAKNHNFSLIVVDIESTDEAGPGICSCLKESETTKYIPLILLSSLEQKKNIISRLQAGAEDYMTKPINNNELLARVDTHLRTKDYYTELGKQDLLMVLERTEVVSVTRNPKKILRIIVSVILSEMSY
jgi:two-component system cell cycle response regulator